MIRLVKDTIDNKDIDKLIEWLGTYPHLTKGPLTLELEKKWSNLFKIYSRKTEFMSGCNSLFSNLKSIFIIHEINSHGISLISFLISRIFTNNNYLCFFSIKHCMIYYWPCKQ